MRWNQCVNCRQRLGVGQQDNEHAVISSCS
jgi:hypothetical protein